MSKAEKGAKAPEETVGIVEQTAVEDIYTVQELTAASRQVFKVPPECVVAALKPTRKEKMTVSEARTVIEAFMNKEVK